MNPFKKQSGFATAIIILIVAIVIIAGGAGYYSHTSHKVYQGIKKPEMIKPEQAIDEIADLPRDEVLQDKTLIDETANWETYKNRGYGYEFKYPDDFYVKITNMVRIEKISDFPEEPNLGPSLGAVLEERDSINSSGIDTDCSLLVLSGQPQGIKSYCRIKQFNQVKGKLQKFYIGEDPSFGISFIFYQKDARISISGHRGLPELYPLDYQERIKKFNEYFDSVARKDPDNPDLTHYDTFKKMLSTLKFIELEKVEQDVCEKLTDDYKKKQCYIDAAIKTGNISLCKKTYDEDGCYIGVAIGFKDDSLCEKVSMSGRKDLCYQGMTMETKDSRYCEKVTRIESRDTCYSVIAMETGDSSPCEKMTDIVQKKGGHVDISKDKCYFDLAVETKDANICEKIIPDKGFVSYNECYVKVAAETNDSGLCEKITDITDNVLGKKWYKDWCYSDLAIKTENAVLCEKLTDNAKKDNCYFNIAIKIKDAILCEKMTDSERKDGCYFEIAVPTKNSSLCEKIKNSLFKDRCYQWISR